jgi:aminoglycoside/choline kinase family phosphotransferase
MQALGAYANLSRNLGKPHFEQHIPAAIANLTEVCQEGQGLHDLRAFFEGPTEKSHCSSERDTL